MIRHRVRRDFSGLLLILAALSCLQPSAHAYTVNCDQNSSDITSVLGETRPSSLYPPGRFHTGVDLGGCDDGESVTAIKAGTADYVPECATPNDCRRLVASDGSVFDYIHIRNAVTIGSNVAQGSQVGLVDGDHLHLAQVRSVGTFAINPQFVGQLDFNRSVDALATFKQIAVGAVTDSVIPVQAFNQDILPNQTATPFVKMNDTYFVRGNVDILVTANAKPGTTESDRKGVFMVGALVLQSGSLAHLYEGRANIPFRSLVDQVPNNQGFRTIYFSTQTDSRTYWATNLKINHVTCMQARNSEWNSDGSPEGAVRICGVVKTFPGANELWSCKDAVIDRTAPTVTLTDTADVPFSFATSSTTIKVVGTETVSASGIYTITLFSSGGSQTSTNTSVTTSYTATFSGLTDGQYTALVTDLAGNQASVSFIIGRDQFLIEGRA